VGPALDGTVLGVFSRAVVVGVRTESGPRVVSLLAREAASVPNGVRPTCTSAFPALRAGGPARIGGGHIRIGGLDVHVVRSWSTRVRVIDPETTSVVALATAANSERRGVPLPSINRLRVALNPPAGAGRGDHDLTEAVDGLVGLGRGLTPGGDDVLAGVLTGLHAVGRVETAAAIGDRALRLVTERTTLLSADLLGLAAAGEACLEALAVLRAIHRPWSANAVPRPGGAGARATEAINRLLSIGHTSGADLATGLAIGLVAGRGVRERHSTQRALGSDREAALTAAGQGAR
jgi:hypothetical protein